jgi:hypothetical protein
MEHQDDVWNSWHLHAFQKKLLVVFISTGVMSGPGCLRDRGFAGLTGRLRNLDGECLCFGTPALQRCLSVHGVIHECVNAVIHGMDHALSLTCGRMGLANGMWCLRTFAV